MLFLIHINAFFDPLQKVVLNTENVVFAHQQMYSLTNKKSHFWLSEMHLEPKLNIIFKNAVFDYKNIL